MPWPKGGYVAVAEAERVVVVDEGVTTTLLLELPELADEAGAPLEDDDGTDEAATEDVCTGLLLDELGGWDLELDDERELERAGVDEDLELDTELDKSVVGVMKVLLDLLETCELLALLEGDVEDLIELPELLTMLEPPALLDDDVVGRTEELLDGDIVD